MITNLCPTNGNAQWCDAPGVVNSYGYDAHFDLMNGNNNGLITALGWNNPEVVYKPVPCGSGGSPPSSDFSQCVCSTTQTTA